MKRLQFPFLLFVVIVLLFANLTIAQEAAIEPNDFGTSGINYLMIPGTEFLPSNSATGYAKPFLFLQRTGGGDAEFTHVMTLPAGALVQSVTAYVGDTNATAGVDVSLRMCILFALPGGATQDINCDEGIGLPGISTTGNPGATALVMNVNQTFLNVQNGADTSHIIVVGLGAPNGTTWLHSVRVQWKRQISPAPATATFADVPTTHPFFQFIEALAASGVTGGCSGAPLQYCPDANITRGQMAVFLSRALGLHWVP